MNDYLENLIEADKNAAKWAACDQAPDLDIDDIDAWRIEYRQRLSAAILPGRNKARNKTVLAVLVAIMQANQRLGIVASLRYLTINANMDIKTVVGAITELRAQGYLYQIAHAGKDGTIYRLNMDILPEVEAKSDGPKTGLKSVSEGNFSHDAYHAKAMSKTNRLIYEYIQANPGLTSYGIAKAIKIDPRQQKRQ